MHKILKRQLKKLGLDEQTQPTREAWLELIQSISKYYEDGDSERYLLDRSLAISSREMEEQSIVIRASEEKLRSLFECAPDIIFSLDRAGTLLFVNRTLPSVSKEDILGKNAFEIFGAEQGGRLHKAFTKVLTTASPHSVEIFFSPDGKEHWFETRLAPVKQLDGNVESVLMVLTEITERKQMERALEEERARSSYASKMATLGEMAGGIAHEINNPLAIIQGFAQQLKRFAQSADMARILNASERIEATTVRIARTVGALRSFAREGSQEPKKETLILGIIEETLELCHQRFLDHSIDLVVSGVPRELSVNCRSVQIAQVLMNLLGNAHDAVESLPRKWVRVEAFDRGASVDLVVTDSGSGIPAELREKVLKPFFTTKPAGRGTGLGLSISRVIVESHGGRIFVDPDCPNTRFVVSLPKGRDATAMAA